MKKYFLHNGTESSGPFDFEELRVKKITKKTPVWFEGMENWKYAEGINELKSLFTPTPPPIEVFSTIPPTPIKKKTINQGTILGLSKNSFFIVFGMMLLITATLVFNNYQENRDRELKLKNHKTEVENYQYELQQKEIEEQKIILAEQEKKEAERATQEKKQNDNNRLQEIDSLIRVTKESLEKANEKLKDVSGFKLLRSAAEKKEQMDLMQTEINSYKNDIEKLNIESNQLKLELEKIH